MVFRRRRAGRAPAADGTQQAQVVVHGRYSPNVIRAQAGRPLRVVFDRREGGECTSRVVFPELGISAVLPPFTQTAVELTPGRPGFLEFECGMNKIHGYVVVAPGRPAATHAAPQGAASPPREPRPQAGAGMLTVAAAMRGRHDASPVHTAVPPERPRRISWQQAAGNEAG